MRIAVKKSQQLPPSPSSSAHLGIGIIPQLVGRLVSNVHANDEGRADNGPKAHFHQVLTVISQHIGQLKERTKIEKALTLDELAFMCGRDQFFTGRTISISGKDRPLTPEAPIMV